MYTKTNKTEEQFIMTIKNEEWKAVPGYEGLYQVSDQGRVRSLDRKVTDKSGRVMSFKGTDLKQIKDHKGRLCVNLRKNNTPKRMFVHYVVALTFIGERPEGYHVCHINGDHTDNKLTNIRYDTVSQNQIDMYRYGKKSSVGKLSIEQVLEIRKLFDTGDYTRAKLGEMFDVSGAHVGRIISRKFFPWLNDDGSIDESNTAIN